MVELKEDNLRSLNRNSSKGNQLKWKADGSWYKADYMGYEGLSEYMVSHILKSSSLKDAEYVLYETELIRYKNSSFRGCRSEDFLKKGQQLITLERLYKNYSSRSLITDVWNIAGVKDRIRFLVNTTINLTGLKDFGSYLSIMLTIDALFLNEDRHMHNIAVIMQPDKTYTYCPYFDHGAALLSDTTLDYPMGDDYLQLIRTASAKTICPDFDEALDAAEELYGYNIKFDFGTSYIRELTDMDNYYSKTERNRIYDILMYQYRKYSYLF